MNYVMYSVVVVYWVVYSVLLLPKLLLVQRQLFQ
jgi:hypothetical protein